MANLFGEPGQGFHETSIGPGRGLAAWDIIGTLFFAYVISVNTDRYSFAAIAAALFVIGILAHELFGVNTRLNAWLFDRQWP